MRYSSKWPTYAMDWDRMQIKSGRGVEFERDARRLVTSKNIYQVIEKRTGVPWPLIALLHLRESDADFSTYLGNGDPLKRKTTHVPKGRGPFKTFEDGAVDALKLDGLTSIKDWRLEKMLYYAELFNGAGYDMRGKPSPYLWGGTNIQQKGKFVADGKWNPNVWDSQPGIAPILAEMIQMDSSIRLQRED